MPGYSPGPSRFVPMHYAEAEQTFETARFPDRGKPLPGKNVRLFQEKDDFYVSYHDTPVVTIHRDGTYTLDHGGYPSRMTQIRMQEYSPGTVGFMGKREYRTRNPYEEPWLGYDNLMLEFQLPMPMVLTRGSLHRLYYPERFSYECTLPFPRETLRIDPQGRPVLDDLLEDIAPPAWRVLLKNRLQPWEKAPRLTVDEAPVPPALHAAAYWRKWPYSHAPAGSRISVDPTLDQILLVRRSWRGSRPVASIWAHKGKHGSPPRIRWVIPSTDKSGQSGSVELAVRRVDRELRKEGWSSAPPRLGDVLGNLASQLGVSRTQTDQPLLPFKKGLLVDRFVLRVHWAEPWTTREWYKESYPYSSRVLPRNPIPGSEPWPGPEDVRVWFELEDGTAVGIVHEAKKGHDNVVVHHGAFTKWDTPGVLAAGLLASIGAALLGWLG